jgi:hypothetical protein
MESVEKLGYPGWIHTAAAYVLHVAAYIGLSPDRSYRGDGPWWMESRLKPRTAAMDGIGIFRRYFHSTFCKNIQSF